VVSLTFAPPLAHLGHWYVSLPVFMGPVVVLALALKVQTWREAHKRPDRAGKRSSVSSSSADERVTIAVSGPLDYPALLETEVELGKVAHDAHAIVLDLRRLTTADEESAAGLCDVIAGTHAEERISVLLPREPCASHLNAALASEGIRLVRGGGLAVNR
jgi:ABC-type transporter Mla MlaB component